MALHNPRERALFRDLNDKNRMTEEFRRLSSRLRSWKKRMGRKKGKRWQAQYSLSIERAQDRLAEMRPLLLAWAEELKARIEEEQKLSTDEIKQFESFPGVVEVVSRWREVGEILSNELFRKFNEHLKAEDLPEEHRKMMREMAIDALTEIVHAD